MGPLTELLAVLRVHTSTVDNAGALRNGGRDCLRKEGTDVGMRLLCLGGSGDLAGTNGPDRLVRNHDFATGARP